MCFVGKTASEGSGEKYFFLSESAENSAGFAFDSQESVSCSQASVSDSQEPFALSHESFLKS